MMRFNKVVAVAALIFVTFGAYAGGRRRGAVSVPLLQAHGAITAVSATSITVGGSTFAINAATELRKLTLADLKTGVVVHVKGSLQNGVAVAQEIELENENEPGEDHGTATANGIVASIGANSLVVHRAPGDDVTVQVSAATAIKAHGVAIAFTAIKAGDRVETRGTRVDDHTIAAVQIEVENENEKPEDHESSAIAGIVSSVGSSTFVVHGANGTDTTVQVDAATKIKSHGKTIPFAAIKVASRVEVKGARVDAQTILAHEVEVEEAK